MGNYIQGIKIAYSGASVTLTITSVAVFIGIVVGLLVALCRISNVKILKIISVVYVEVLRGTPILVQALLIYSGLPMLLQAMGGSFTWDNPILAGIIVCGVNSSAYVSEIFRSGLNAVDKGQMEAARSLGMSYIQAMKTVIVPQAFKIVLPALANEFVSLLKETSILSMITIVEVTRKSMLWASATFLTFPAYIGTAIVYMSMTIPLSKAINLLERKMSTDDKN